MNSSPRYPTPNFRHSVLIFTSLSGLLLLGGCSTWDAITGSRTPQNVTGPRHQPVLNPTPGNPNPALPPQAAGEAVPAAVPPPTPAAAVASHKDEMDPYDQYTATGEKLPEQPGAASQPGDFFHQVSGGSAASDTATRKPLAGNPNDAATPNAVPVATIAQPAAAPAASDATPHWLSILLGKPSDDDTLPARERNAEMPPVAAIPADASALAPQPAAPTPLLAPQSANTPSSGAPSSGAPSSTEPTLTVEHTAALEDRSAKADAASADTPEKPDGSGANELSAGAMNNADMAAVPAEKSPAEKPVAAEHQATADGDAAPVRLAAAGADADGTEAPVTPAASAEAAPDNVAPKDAPEKAVSEEERPHWLSILLGAPSADKLTTAHNASVEEGTVSSSTDTPPPAQDVRPAPAGTRPPVADSAAPLTEKKTVAEDKGSSWLPDIGGWFGSDEKAANAKVDADQRETTTPSLSTVPPNPATFQQVKTTKQQDTQALQTEHTQAAQDKDQLAAEPSQQDAQTPVPVPEPAKADTAEPAPAQTPAAASPAATASSGDKPVLLGHAVEDAAAKPPAQPDAIDLTAPVTSFNDEDKPLTASKLDASTPDHAAAAQTSAARPADVPPSEAQQPAQDSAVRKAPAASDDDYVAIPLPASAEANRVIQPDTASPALPPIDDEAHETRPAGTLPAEASPAIHAPMAETPAATDSAAAASPPSPTPVETTASAFNHKDEPAPAPAQAASPASAESNAAAAQPAAVTLTPMEPAGTISSSPAEATGAPLPAMPVPTLPEPSGDLPNLTPANAPVASVQVQENTGNTANNGSDSGSALPSSQLLDEVKVLPPSRYATRVQALHNGQSQ